MAIGRTCGAARIHKPHLWSRTTRKTVTEETPGDTFECTGVLKAPAKKDTRAAEIKADAHSGTNWARLVNYGPACVCGAGERTLMAAKAFVGMHGKPTGECTRHPGGTIARNPEGTTYPGENGN